MAEELVRVLVTSPPGTDPLPLDGVLTTDEGYELQIVPNEDVSDALDRDRPDIILVVLDEESSRDDTKSVRSGWVRRTLSLAGPSPVLLLVPAVREDEAEGVRALREACTDYLVREKMSPPDLRRAIQYGVQTARAEQRRRQTERALAESEQRYRTLFQQSRDGIFMTDAHGALIELNAAAGELLGHEVDRLIGRDVRTLFVDPEDRSRFLSGLESGGEIRDLEVRLRKKGGEDLWCQLTAWTTRAEDGRVEGYQAIVHDISARKQIEERLTREAFHDSLTGLPNRALFMDRLERAVARRRRGEQTALAVLFLDMDRFKWVNDSLGHLAGDQLLQRMGQVLTDQVREVDTVARIGGDEFAILLDGVEEPSDCTQVAERIQERLRTPFRLAGQDVFSSVSIGIALGGAEVERPEDLLSHADSAMYRAKELGPARYQIYDRVMHAHAVSLLQLETDLRLALERREFTLHYQPVVDVADERVVGFESLIRWQHPTRGLLLPQAFLPVAEDSGLIGEIGDWSLRAAAMQLREWQAHDNGHSELFMAVNLSPRQFTNPRLADTVRAALAESGVPPHTLRLEVTEAAIMSHPTSALEILEPLQHLGVDLCIDHFGTSYSALSHLTEFPLRSLKIDRSFVQRLDQETGRTILRAVIALARKLGIPAVAVGVETEGQLERLRAFRTTSAQGFLFSPAVDASAAAALLDEAGTRPRAADTAGDTAG